MPTPLEIIARIRVEAARADAMHERSRRMLVDAARAGASAGLSQRDIAAAIGRSQPEVARLLRFHGTSPLGRKLRAHRTDVLRVLDEAGIRQPRVFGSVGRGEDHEGSDVDLLVSLPEGISLIELGRIEHRLSELVDAPVELTPDSALRPHLRSRVLAEAVPL